MLVAHNARFDLSMLHLEYQRIGRTMPDLPVLDTMTLARWLQIGVTRHRLPDLLAHYGLPLTRHHDAAADASDTAALLRRLLADAASAGISDLTAAHPDTGTPGPLRRTGDYPPAEPHRGLRARRRSRFTYIDRPADHLQTHQPLAKQPTRAELDRWLENARTCIQLRCPALPGKADSLHHDRDRIAEQLLTDWHGQLTRGESAAANTALGAALVLLPKVVAPADAPGWLARWEPVLRQAVRCAPLPGPDDDTGRAAPVDGCTDCRAGRGCPADCWPGTAAGLLAGPICSPFATRSPPGRSRPAETPNSDRIGPATAPPRTGPTGAASNSASPPRRCPTASNRWRQRPLD